MLLSALNGDQCLHVPLIIFLALVQFFHAAPHGTEVYKIFHTGLYQEKDGLDHPQNYNRTNKLQVQSFHKFQASKGLHKFV
jgi:hypothetical protein